MPFRSLSTRLDTLLLCGLLCGMAVTLVPETLSAQDDGENPLLVQPETPVEVFEAAVFMERIRQPRFAKQYLQQYVDGNPSDDDLLKLYDDKGIGVFLKLRRNAALKPIAGPLYDRLTAAIRKRSTDPTRINRLVNNLSSPERGTRETAILTLKAAGPEILPAIVSRLASPRDANERNSIVYGLSRMGNQMVPGLVATLEADDEALRIAALNAIGYLGQREDVESLWYYGFSPDLPESVQATARTAIGRILELKPTQLDQIQPVGVAKRLREEAVRHLQNRVDWQLNTEDLVEVWDWVPEQETIRRLTLEPQTAAYFQGSKFARQHLGLQPQDEEAQALFLGLTLATAAHLNGTDQPLPTGPGTAYDLALTSGPDVLSESLGQALEHGNGPAAISILRAIARIGSRDDLLTEPSSLLSALSYPDPRVQFVAATTVLDLQPERSFPGAGMVTEVLKRVLNSEYRSAAIVVHPNVDRLNQYAGYVSEMGYETVIARSGKQAFQLAAQRSDIDLIVLHSTMSNWPLSQTMANLRADARTSHLPILVYGPEYAAAKLRVQLAPLARTGFVTESETADYFQVQARPLLRNIQTAPLSAADRKRQAEIAAYRFATIATGRLNDLFELRSAETALASAIDEADLMENSMIALASIPTTSVQERLHEVVTSPGRPIGQRRFATSQLAYHLQRYGVLLRKAEIDELLKLREATQDQILATNLSTIQGLLRPDPEAIAERLRNFKSPTLTPVEP